MQEVYSWISACLMTSSYGVKVPSPDPDKLRQAVERAMRNLPERPAISLLTRHNAAGGELWLVRNEFMNGKKLDDVKIRALFQQEDQSPSLLGPSSSRGPAGDLPQV